MPRLKTRRSSASSTPCSASQPKTGGRSHAAGSTTAESPSGRTAREIARDAAARHVRERADVRPRAQLSHGVEIADGRRQEQVRVERPVADDATDEREPVRVKTCGGEADDDVAGLDPRAVDQLGPAHDTDDGPAEVELLGAVDAGQLRRLASEDRAACRPAHVGGTLDELRDVLGVDPARRDVVEEEERLGACREDVVDPVGGEIGPAPAQPPGAPAEDELRADRVGRGREEPVLVDREEAREGAEGTDDAGRSRRLDGLAQAVDDRIRRRERDAGSSVGLLVPRHRASLHPVPARFPGRRRLRGTRGPALRGQRPHHPGRADNHPQGHPRCPTDTLSRQPARECARFVSTS